MERRRRRRPADNRAGRARRGRCLRDSDRVRERRRARARAEPTHRRASFPPGPRRHVARPAARARRRARRLSGNVAGGSLRLAAGLHRRPRPRRVHVARGAALAHGRLGGRDRPPLPRGGAERAPQGERAARARACRGDPARSRARPGTAPRRRRPRLPRSDGDDCRRDRRRARDGLGGHAAVPLRPQRGRLRGIPASRPGCPPALDRHGQGHGRAEHADRGDARRGARELRGRRDRRRRDLRTARHALRASARPRNEGREGRCAQGRPLVRARHDRDPHPRADPRQAGRRRRGPERLAEPRHARRRLRRPAAGSEPALRLARQGHLRQRDLDRPLAHATHPHRGHDGLGQVGVHQHDPHVHPPARDA